MLFWKLVSIIRFIRQIFYLSPHELAERERCNQEKERLRLEAIAREPKYDCERGKHKWGKWRTYGISYKIRNCEICNDREISS